MNEKRYSQKRACVLAGIDPCVYRRVSKRPTDTDLLDRLSTLSSERRRFGYRRLHILLNPEGWQVNWKKLYRVYRDEGLTVRKRSGRKRAVSTRAPMAISQGPNQWWSLDPRQCLSDQWRSNGSMSDSLPCGRRFRILNVTHDFSCKCLAAVFDTSLSGDRVGHELDCIALLRAWISLCGVQRQWDQADFECDPEVATKPQG